ncbi:hypothetical protein [Saccharopolyspora hattusasensis]|uniref:hypothetical protein n=1 Tax=Saccharopolyspora hattusasensis TaxID=1128679 RepID=UPI003D99E65B
MNLETFEGGEHPIMREIRDVIIARDQGRPRSRQSLVGPSEVGQECARRLAYRMMREPKPPQPAYDPWAAITGTAVHTWLAEAFAEANERLGRVRYLIEKTVEIRPGLSGSCDLYDADRAIVIDHKNVGTTMAKKYREDGPSEQYRVQAHLYGRGFRNLGLPVKEVAIVFFPKAGNLGGTFIWSEPYSDEVVDQALARHDTILEASIALDVTESPENYERLPKSVSRLCRYCPWFQPGGSGRTCPGE